MKRPIRILHVVGAMNVGGAETWLMHVLRNIDRDVFHMDFLVHSPEPGFYDAEIRSLGSRVIVCSGARRPWSYESKLRQIQREFGAYDVVHSHVHHFSGFVLRCAQRAGIRVRIAHCHSATTRAKGLGRHLYLTLMKRLVRRHATHGLGCSTKAAEDLFTPHWQLDKRISILYCGIDLEPYKSPIGRDAARRMLGIPKDAFVVGHVGRFNKVKNHTFLFETFLQLLKLRPASVLVMIGEGPSRKTIEDRAKLAGLETQVQFLGLRKDVARCLESMDVLVLPSLYEGMPLVMIEAQSANVPCVVSSSITREAMLCSELVHYIELDQGATEWAKFISRIDTAANTPEAHASDALRRVVGSKFDITAGILALKNLYLDASGR
jgi:glycosyltransferase involved in cell wall biosynthesis